MVVGDLQERVVKQLDVIRESVEHGKNREEYTGYDETPTKGRPMTKTKLAKNAAAIVVGVTTAKVVKQIIKNNTQYDNVTDQAAIVIAGYVLGAIAADAAKDWTDDKVDKLIAWWTANVTAQI